MVVKHLKATLNSSEENGAGGWLFCAFFGKTPLKKCSELPKTPLKKCRVFKNSLEKVSKYLQKSLEKVYLCSFKF